MVTDVTRTGTDRRARTAARLGVAGGLLGAVQAAAIALWPAAVGPDRWSFPFTPGGAAVAQVGFAVQHLLLVAGVVALLRLARRPLTRAGLWGGLVGLGLLTVMELVAIAAAGEATGSPTASLVESLYGVPTLLIGVALVVAGVGALRDDGLPGPRWLVLVTGGYVFVVLVPALLGPFTLARIAIGVWMLLFAWAFLAAARRP